MEQVTNHKSKISPVQTTFFKSDTTLFDDKREAFHDIFRRSLNNKSNSRPPKLEVTGVLVPLVRHVYGKPFKFKLETRSNEYLLKMNSSLEGIAKMVEWEEVTVKGYLDLESNVLEVEKISIKQTGEPLRAGPSRDDPFAEDEHFERTIAQYGKLEPSHDYLAS